MRLWSIHPKYLDTAGLVALWREGLLAQKVLSGETSGYKNHPQLKRFRKHPFPLKAISSYLIEIWKESRRRGYHFNKEKIGKGNTKKRIPITRSELGNEFDWLCDKLRKRAPHKYRKLFFVNNIDPHPFFKIMGD
jgi:hypothetical protein